VAHDLHSHWLRKSGIAHIEVGAAAHIVLMNLSARQIARLQHPARSDRFADGTGPSIREFPVVKMEASRED
jgi:hypothetical protein